MQTLLTLLGKTTKLLELRRNRRQMLYREFVFPAVEALDELHTDYLASIREYQNIVRDPDQGPIDLIKAVKDDSVYSANLRSQIGVLESQKEDKDMGSFIKRLITYLGGQQYAQYTSMNSYRAGILCLAIDAVSLRSPLLNDLQYNELSELIEIAEYLGRNSHMHREIQRDLCFLKRKRGENALDRVNNSDSDNLPALTPEEKSQIETEWRGYMGGTLFDAVQRLQQAYDSIMREHQRLKVSLLK